MNRAIKILKYGLAMYLVYVFTFSFLIYSFHPTSGNAENKTSAFSANHTNDRVALIETPEEAIAARLDLIENAESSLNIAYYKWADGKVSDLMLGSVLDAADRGVEVRIILDGILQLGNIRTRVDEVFLGFASHPNIEIKVYEPFNPLTPMAWNNRMHDKMIMVDNEFGLLGGRNIEDRFYLEDAHKKGLVKDREVLVYNANDSSSALDDMEEYYDQLWNYKHSKFKNKKMSTRKVNKGDAALTQLRAEHQESKNTFLTTHFEDIQPVDWASESLPTENIHFVSNSLGRMNQVPKGLNAILQLATEADESIFIQSPYFIPSRKMLARVNEEDIDPEKTTLFTNSEAISPNVVAISAYNNRRKYMVDSGAKIFEYQGPGSTHGKSGIFDEQISVVGTFNIDPRSSYINTEAMMIIDSTEFAEDLKQGIGVNFDTSLQVDEDYSYIEHPETEPAKLPLPRKILIRLLSFVTPVFEKLL